jgi:predicted O-methyltransferase YrrM
MSDSLNGWKFPAEVTGWLTEEEGRCLARLAAGKRVLEIGSFEGRSTICMAQTAARVDCIDPCDGRGTPDRQEHLAAWRRNMRRFNLGAKMHVGTTEEVAPDLDPGYDLVFIDGAHDLDNVRVDVREAKRLLAPGGLIAFHDFRPRPGHHDGRWDPDVTAAVAELMLTGGRMVETAGTVAVVQLGPPPTEKPVVMLAMPRYGRRVAFGAARGYFYWPTLGKCTVVLADSMGSALTSNFNGAWCAALNARKRGVTHFAMIHDDVSPAQGWLDTLLAEMFRLDADAVSAVIPIKSEHGLTSTAYETDDPWNPRRLTLTEAEALPETFGSDDLSGEVLLNTGLWVCDLRKPWADGEGGPPCFTIDNRIVRGEGGDYARQFWSEDWDFSRQIRRRGARGLYATRKVQVEHEGEASYPSAPAWGTWKTDELHERKEEPACATA